MFFFVFIFLIHLGEEFLKFFFLLNGLFLLLFFCQCTDNPCGNTNNGTQVGCRLLGFDLPLPFLRVIGFAVDYPAKCSSSPQASTDSTTDRKDALATFFIMRCSKR